MVPTDSLELAIQKERGRVYLCTLDELCALLPHFSPAQVAAMVERLTQEGYFGDITALANRDTRIRIEAQAAYLQLNTC